MATLIATTFAILPVTGHAATSPYSGRGYDASSYQCVNGVPIALDGTYTSFGIVRVTGGRPFSSDSCRGALWQQAAASTATPSLYVNVAYSGAYGHYVSGSCSALNSVEGYTGKYLQAYRIGCAESDYAFSHRPSGAAPAMWWLDVETANSWSGDRNLNQAAIDGAADWLGVLTSASIGVYSYPGAWGSITSGAGFAPHSASATWVANVANCSSSFSTALPEWLFQYGNTATGADADYAC